MQVDFQPEYRTRVTGVERGLVMGLEVSGSGLRADIGNARLTIGVFEHLQGSAQGEALSELIELDCACHEGQAKQQHQQIAHLSPSVACPVISGSPSFLLSRRKTGITCYWFGSTLA
ncbi:hypothetical protein D3C84_862790 [compost metagenome]